MKFLNDLWVNLSPSKNIKSLTTNLRSDILAGITVGIIALPLALAFGEISKLGPVAGIWGAIAGGIVGGLFGGCMVGVSGPTAPKATQIAAFLSMFVVGTTNQPDLVAAFSIIFLSGVILVILSTLKISRYIHYTPYPVIAGFMCGIGVIVILTQINAFIGLEAEKNIHDLFKNFRQSINNINVEALYVSVPSLIILFLWTTLEKKYIYFRYIPSPLFALLVGSSIAYTLNLDIPYIGDKMSTSSGADVFQFYIPDLTRTSEFIFPALALAILAVLDSLLSCKVADNMTGVKHNSDQETFGQGMANMAAGLVGGVTTATATMRTVANIKFGAKTPLASIVHGLTLLTILLGLGFLVASIPSACLAAILFKVGIDILDYRILPVIRRVPISDLIIFFIVLFVTVYKDLMIAVAIGTIFAIAQSYKEIVNMIKSRYSYKTKSLSKSDLTEKFNNKENLSKSSTLVLELNGPLFFGSLEQIESVYEKAQRHKVLIIDMRNSSKIDLSGAYGLEDLIKISNDRGVKSYIYCENEKIRKLLMRVNIFKYLGSDCLIGPGGSATSTI